MRNIRRSAIAISAATAVLAVAVGIAPRGEVRAAPGSGSRPVNPAGIVVDDDATCPGWDYATIQAAVTASPPGSVIQVCPGVYPEQVIIEKPLTLRGVHFADQNQAIVMPTPNGPNTTSLSSGNLLAAIILVKDTDRVTVESLTVDGLGGTGTGNCTVASVGIYYRNASGTIQTDAVRNVTNGLGLTGCQGGLGIFVQSGGGGESKVDIEDNAVHDYDKNGITANEPGTEVTIRGNTVTGRGLVILGDAAQNGIQIGFGATGKIERNSVIDHIYGPCISIEDCNAATAGIGLFGDSIDPVVGVEVRDNEVGSSQVGIWLDSAHGNDVKGNRVFHTLVFDGIALIGNNNKADGNEILDSDEAGISVLGDNNKAHSNFINEALCGVFDAGGSGNSVTNNQFFNTTERVCTEEDSLSFAPATSGPKAEAFR